MEGAVPPRKWWSKEELFMWPRQCWLAWIEGADNTDISHTFFREGKKNISWTRRRDSDYTMGLFRVLVTKIVTVQHS